MPLWVVIWRHSRRQCYTLRYKQLGRNVYFKVHKSKFLIRNNYLSSYFYNGLAPDQVFFQLRKITKHFRCNLIEVKSHFAVALKSVTVNHKYRCVNCRKENGNEGVGRWCAGQTPYEFASDSNPLPYHVLDLRLLHHMRTNCEI